MVNLSHPVQQLHATLSHATTLLGLAPSARLPPANRSLAAVLHARLEAYHAIDPAAHAARSGLVDASDERAVQRATALAALDLLERTASLLSSLSDSPEVAPSAPSTSSGPARMSVPPPPVFSIAETKALAQLAAVVGRWAMNADSRLPAASASKATQNAKIVEISPEDEEEIGPVGDSRRFDQMRRVTERVVRLLGVDSQVDLRQKSPGEKQFLGTVLPQLLGPLVSCLAQCYNGDQAQDPWARTALDNVFRLTPTPTVLSTLLSLVASTRPSTPLRSRLSALLSDRLLQPGGVRSLLIVVMGVGSAGGGDDEVSVQKLEMVRKVLETPPSDKNAELYFENVSSQLLDLLRSAATASCTAALAQYGSTAAKGKSRSGTLSSATAAEPTSNVPVPILRAAAWSLAHFVVAPPRFAAGSVTQAARRVSRQILHQLHTPLLPCTCRGSVAATAGGAAGQETKIDPNSEITGPALAAHLTLLSLLTLYAPPLPTWIHTLLDPLLPPLFSLLSFLAVPKLVVVEAVEAEQGEAIKRVIQDEASALLRSFAKSVAIDEGVKAISLAVERWEAGDEFGAVAAAASPSSIGPKGDETMPRGMWKWAWSEAGEPELVSRAPEVDGHHHAMGSLEEEDGDPEAGELQLRVDAVWLVGWLASLEHKELVAGLFLRWLDEVKVLRGVDDAQGARRAVTRLQLVLQMVERLGSDILAHPREIIAFVAHALDAEIGEPEGVPAGTTNVRKKDERNPKPHERERSGLAGLRIVEVDDVEGDGPKVDRAGDEDEEDAELGLGTGFAKDEMAMTALTLLLAVLEADEKLDMSNTPLLAVIYTQLESLSNSTTSALIPPLAREARMVLSLRRASSAFAASEPPSTRPDGTPDPLAASRETYRNALKLLQDPLLPVRAQGLHLLRSLVLDKENALLSTDPALLPAVLDIFVAALEEEDSFLYLNAVQGLSSLVDIFGRQVLGRLMEVYTGTRRDERGGPKEVGLGERGLRELDKRLRVGEALVQVVHRAGEALALSVHELLPPLLVVLRSSYLPVPLRASAITILATCVETAPAAVVQYADTLTEACVTLLQIESVPLAPRARPAIVPIAAPATKGKQKKVGPRSGVLIEEVDNDDEDEESASVPPILGKDGKPRRPEELPDPTTTASKHPTLRRAAIVFLGALVRTIAHQAAETAERSERAAAAGYDERDPLGLGGEIRLPFQATVRGASSGDFLLRARGAGPFRMEAGSQGSLLDPEQVLRARTVLRYVSETDEDALVREQSAQVLRELEG